ncbi:hypothetical protein ACVBE9_00605 [Eionea flava]
MLSQNNRVVLIRALFKWLARNNHLLYNPASDLEMLRVEKWPSKAVLSEEEAETILNLLDTSTPIGLR